MLAALVMISTSAGLGFLGGRMSAWLVPALDDQSSKPVKVESKETTSRQPAVASSLAAEPPQSKGDLFAKQEGARARRPITRKSLKRSVRNRRQRRWNRPREARRGPNSALFEVGLLPPQGSWREPLRHRQNPNSRSLILARRRKDQVQERDARRQRNQTRALWRNARNGTLRSGRVTAPISPSTVDHAVFVGFFAEFLIPYAEGPLDGNAVQLTQRNFSYVRNAKPELAVR